MCVVITSGLQILREIDDALRALDQIRIQRRVVEAVAEVAGMSAEITRPWFLDALQKLVARLGIHVLRRKLALRRINLNALCADSRSPYRAQVSVSVRKPSIRTPMEKGLHRKHSPFLEI